MIINIIIFTICFILLKVKFNKINIENKEGCLTVIFILLIFNLLPIIGIIWSGINIIIELIQNLK